jgi:hypothetical protein
MSRACATSRFAVALAAMTAMPLPAFEVYHWVDQDGVAHYSQWQPASGDPDFRRLTLEETATAGVGGDVYPVQEQVEAMEALWQALEQEREDRRARRRETPPAAVVYYPQPVAQAVWPLWLDDPRLRPRPPHRPKPSPDPSPEPELEESATLKPPGH